MFLQEACLKSDSLRNPRVIGFGRHERKEGAWIFLARESPTKGLPLGPGARLCGGRTLEGAVLPQGIPPGPLVHGSPFAPVLAPCLEPDEQARHLRGQSARLWKLGQGQGILLLAE